MLTAWISLVSSTSGFHCSTSGTCSHTPIKFGDAEFINKKMAAIFVKQLLFWSTDHMFEKKFAQRKPFSIEGCSFHCCNRSTLAHICSHLMSALRRSVSALWNTKGRFMIFFWKTKIFEMFMAYLRMDGSGNGLHCFNRRTCRHTWYKGIFRETLSIARAAILLKKV